MWLGNQVDHLGTESPWQPLTSWLSTAVSDITVLDHTAADHAQPMHSVAPRCDLALSQGNTAELVALLAPDSELSIFDFAWATPCAARVLTAMAQLYETTGTMCLPLPSSPLTQRKLRKR